MSVLNRCDEAQPVSPRSKKKRDKDETVTVPKLKFLDENMYQYEDDEIKSDDEDDEQTDSDDTTQNQQTEIKLSQIRKKMKKIKRNFDNGNHHPILSSELIVPLDESQTPQKAKAARNKLYAEIKRKITKMKQNEIPPTKQITNIIEATLSTAHFVELRDSGCTTQEIIDFANSNETNTAQYLATLTPKIETRNFRQPYQHIIPCEWDEKFQSYDMI